MTGSARPNPGVNDQHYESQRSRLRWLFCTPESERTGSTDQRNEVLPLALCLSNDQAH
jgi:hypothetical protein